MKLNAKLILISFAIVLIISVSSMSIYYSLTQKLISNQQNQAILNSANDFVFAFENFLQKPEEDFSLLAAKQSDFKNVDLSGTNIDFVFTLVGDSLININEYSAKSEGFINLQSKSFKQFFVNNPNVILQYKKFDDGRIVYFGNQINSLLLDSLASDIHAEIALIINDSPIEVSNSAVNQKYLLGIVEAERDLKFKNNFEIYRENLPGTDFVATYFSPRQILTPGGSISFMVFGSFQESADLRGTLSNVALIIVLAGGALSFIFVLLFTTKLRKQISFLTEAVKATEKGELDYRVPVIIKDEVGQLGVAFNNMLDEIKRNRLDEKEYTDFLALINQNPSLHEVCEAALNKILKTTNLNFGLFYIVEKNDVRAVSSIGIPQNSKMISRDRSFYSGAIEKREISEFHFQENHPEIQTGLTQIKLKYLIIYPVVYNKETIAVLELANESVPQINVRNYIEKIHDQLAVGLNNSRSLEQLENLVRELKILNEESHKQNLRIIQQSEKQQELHKQLEEKALELETQRAKAVELSKVKSQFLASMSHELRTPLISILGLTELMSKDPYVSPKTKERVNIVHRNGKKLLGMITNILEFSKFDSGKIELKKESFLLDDVLVDILPSIELLAGEKQLDVEVIKNPNANLVLNTDRTKIEQVLNNFLVNAIKFTEIGKITLQIDLINNSGIEFSVNDTGIGIPDEYKELIFAEFQQLDSGPARKFGGVGLGLAISKKYIELMGGNLMLRSKSGVGSSFSFRLTDVVLDVLDNENERKYEITTQNKINGLTEILLISGSSDTEKIICDYFAEQKINISCASSFEKAHEHLTAGFYKYIIVIADENNNAWKFVNDLLITDSQKNSKIILIGVNNKNKLCVEFKIYNFIPESNLSLIKNAITNNGINGCYEILFISNNKEAAQKIAGILPAACSIKYIDSRELLIRRIETEIPENITIDADSLGGLSTDILMEIKSRKSIQNVPVFFVLPSAANEKCFNELNEKLNMVIENEGMNILDVLKNLEIDSNEDALKTREQISQIEEITDDSKISANISAEKKFGGKPTILIVDDENDSLFTISELVKEMNYETIFAHNGMECLITLNHIEPDLILLDIMMPQMDGFETIRRIRADKKHSHIPVLALTAYAMLDNKNVIEKNGFNDLVTKPVNSKILASKIKENLNLKVTI